MRQKGREGGRSSREEALLTIRGSVWNRIWWETQPTHSLREEVAGGETLRPVFFFLRELRRSFDLKEDGEELEGSERSGAGRCPKFWAGLSV